MSSREERKFRERLQAARGGGSMDSEPTQQSRADPDDSDRSLLGQRLFQACRPLHAGDDTTSGS